MYWHLQAFKAQQDPLDIARLRNKTLIQIDDPGRMPRILHEQTGATKKVQLQQQLQQKRQWQKQGPVLSSTPPLPSPPCVCVCVCVCDETRLMHCSQSHSGLSLPNPPAMLHAARCTTSARLLPQCDVRSTLGSTRFLVHATSLLWVGACVLVHACGLIFLCACSFNSGLHAWSMFTHKNPTH